MWNEEASSLAAQKRSSCGRLSGKITCLKWGLQSLSSNRFSACFISLVSSVSEQIGCLTWFIYWFWGVLTWDLYRGHRRGSCGPCSIATLSSVGFSLLPASPLAYVGSTGSVCEHLTLDQGVPEFWISVGITIIFLFSCWILAGVVKWLDTMPFTAWNGIGSTWKVTSQEDSFNRCLAIFREVFKPATFNGSQEDDYEILAYLTDLSTIFIVDLSWVVVLYERIW